MLIEDGGADVHTRTGDGMTPLHEAVEFGDNVEVVRLLVDNGADVSARKSQCGKTTPLHQAAEHGRPTCFELLVESGADINALTEDTGEASLAIAADCACVYRPGLSAKAGADPPDVAECMPRYERIIRFALANGADVDNKNHGGQTALHGAAFRGNYNIASILLQAGADPTIVSTPPTSPLTAAQLAAVWGHTSVERLIRSYKAKPTKARQDL
ncbi:unnamed protein product [Vitrella brassicaformis CCMP3155]|uniref:Uncharacterized protein n=1 Tax=Vitrella brassicaformis (strain CCMP3155) TaxID=1169540 RepID=A0A0G4GAD9_VITBC|nr:unnamed protein product [Vitrella brassicaformis CCMP3155]|mmetsp:Transcript_5149/g.14165  ORF Transcript_5149/g.14165 Transcript_5149/m.14165 type:complete len:214 (+) Transcript_5149:397-1038(+)|eukprot:CEM25943.1 unnamed protein product [Vitrella brassicaformis CCMP3155]